jgi:hypothetical protein
VKRFARETHQINEGAEKRKFVAVELQTLLVEGGNEFMVIASVIACLVVLGLFLSMLSSPPKTDR